MEGRAGGGRPASVFHMRACLSSLTDTARSPLSGGRPRPAGRGDGWCCGHPLTSCSNAEGDRNRRAGGEGPCERDLLCRGGWADPPSPGRVLVGAGAGGVDPEDGALVAEEGPHIHPVVARPHLHRPVLRRRERRRTPPSKGAGTAKKRREGLGRLRQTTKEVGIKKIQQWIYKTLGCRLPLTRVPFDRK